MTTLFVVQFLALLWNAGATEHEPENAATKIALVGCPDRADQARTRS